MEPSVKAAVTSVVKPQLFTRLKMVDVLRLSEKELAEIVRETEKDPLFRRLLGWTDPRSRVLRRQRYARTGFAGRLLEIKDELDADSGGMDVAKLLQGREKLVEAIRSMGAEKFETYFLRQDPPAPAAEAALACGVSVETAGEIMDFLLEFSVHAEFFHPSKLTLGGGARPSCIGKLESDGQGGFVIGFFAPHLSRGRYRIDYDAWERVRSDGGFTGEERRRASTLLNRVEMLNMRSDTFHRVLTEALQSERAFLQSGKTDTRRVLSQRETSRRINVASSTVSRLLSGRSIVLPWGEEILLASLFPQKKEVLKAILEQHRDSHSALSDGQVQRFLLDRYQMKVPRRTVNYWRHLTTPVEAAR
jgi:DNA-directed RNA polymerase specialized sigma54-like protein